MCLNKLHLLSRTSSQLEASPVRQLCQYVLFVHAARASEMYGGSFEFLGSGRLFTCSESVYY